MSHVVTKSENKIQIYDVFDNIFKFLNASETFYLVVYSIILDQET